MRGKRLEEKLTMYYFDQRGSGRSKAAANNDYSLDRLVEDIENIRMLTGSGQVYLVAHSFGGIPAFKYAEKYPQHVKGLILLNATLYINNSLISQIQFINRLYGSHISVADNDSLMQSFFAAKKIMHERKEDYKMLSDNKATVEMLDSIDAAPREYAFAQRAFGIPDYLRDFTKATANVNVPVLVITGTADHNIGPDHYKLFRFPNQQVKIIKGGHVLYYENNDAFANAVFGFIK
jgi:proline iminopeptidase